MRIVFAVLFCAAACIAAPIGDEVVPETDFLAAAETIHVSQLPFLPSFIESSPTAKAATAAMLKGWLKVKKKVEMCEVKVKGKANRTKGKCKGALRFCMLYRKFGKRFKMPSLLKVAAKHCRRARKLHKKLWKTFKKQAWKQRVARMLACLDTTSCRRAFYNRCHKSKTCRKAWRGPHSVEPNHAKGQKKCVEDPKCRKKLYRLQTGKHHIGGVNTAYRSRRAKRLARWQRHNDAMKNCMKQETCRLRYFRHMRCMARPKCREEWVRKRRWDKWKQLNCDLAKNSWCNAERRRRWKKLHAFRAIKKAAAAKKKAREVRSKTKPKPKPPAKPAATMQARAPGIYGTRKFHHSKHQRRQSKTKLVGELERSADEIHTLNVDHRSPNRAGRAPPKGRPYLELVQSSDPFADMQKLLNKKSDIDYSNADAMFTQQYKTQAVMSTKHSSVHSRGHLTGANHGWHSVAARRGVHFKMAHITDEASLNRARQAAINGESNAHQKRRLAAKNKKKAAKKKAKKPSPQLMLVQNDPLREELEKEIAEDADSGVSDVEDATPAYATARGAKGFDRHDSLDDINYKVKDEVHNFFARHPMEPNNPIDDDF